MLPFLVAFGFAACGPAAAQGDTPRVSYSRIYCTPDGETHFETVAVDLVRSGAPPALPFFEGDARPATRAVFLGFEPRWGEGDLHAASMANTAVMLRGTLSISTTDGETRRFVTGDVIRTEDIAPCKGHTTVAGNEPVLVLFVR